MKSVLQLLHLKRLRASLPLRHPMQEARQQVDPDEQLELLFQDVQRDSEPSATQWQERATVFEDRMRRLKAESPVNSSRRSSLSRLPWTAEDGARLAAFGVGVAVLVGIVVPSPNEVGRQWQRGDNNLFQSRASDLPSSSTSAAVSLVEALPPPRPSDLDTVLAAETQLVNPETGATSGGDNVPGTVPGPVASVSLTPALRKRSIAPALRDGSQTSRDVDAKTAARGQQQAHSLRNAPEPSTRSRAKTETKGAEDTFAAELRALKASDKALKQGRVDEARSMLSRKFSAALAPHATALRAILACQTGARRHGGRLIAAQSKRHPHSPYLRRMRAACGK